MSKQFPSSAILSKKNLFKKRSLSSLNDFTDRISTLFICRKATPTRFHAILVRCSKKGPTLQTLQLPRGRALANCV